MTGNRHSCVVHGAKTALDSRLRSMALGGRRTADVSEADEEDRDWAACRRGFFIACHGAGRVAVPIKP